MAWGGATAMPSLIALVTGLHLQALKRTSLAVKIAVTSLLSTTWAIVAAVIFGYLTALAVIIFQTT